MRDLILSFIAYFILFLLLVTPGCTGGSASEIDTGTGDSVTITDGFGRSVAVPPEINKIICSGSSCLRYIVYLDAEDMLAAANMGAQTNSSSTHDTRPYTIANPQFAGLPTVGSSDSSENLEQIMVIDPQVVFMLGSTPGDESSGTAAKADTMQAKTGIPVVSAVTGSIKTEEDRVQMYSTFRFLGEVLDRESRAEELIAYIEASLADLEERTGDIPELEQKTAYVGGLSHSGAHGLISSQPTYPPFEWVHVKNIAGEYDLDYVEYSKESLLYADPEYIFIDAGTLNLVEEIGGFEDIRSPLFSEMQAIKNGNVYGVMPYNHGGNNMETVLADAYYVGKIVYPERFEDIDPKEKADEIYTMFVGEPVFEQLNANCNNLGFGKVEFN